MTAPDPRLDEIQARLSAATPGPWRTVRHDLSLYVVAESGELNPIKLGYVGNRPENDAAFIANAPADVAYLLAELRKAREALARVEGVATDLATRGAAIEAKGYNGSIYSNRNEGRSLGYLEGARLIRAAVAAAKGDERG